MASNAQIARIPEREPLQNIEAEAAFLGAALINNRVITDLAPNLRAEHFFEPLHARIFERIVERLGAGSAVTAATLKPYFEADEALKELGGITYLARLSADGQGLLMPRELAEQISDLAQRRELGAAYRQSLVDLADFNIPTTEIATAAREAAAAIECEPAAFPLLDFAALANLEPLAKLFIIPRIAPAGEVTLFTGPGAVGKSLLGQQFATAQAAGVSTLGLAFEQGPAIYLTCEDDAEQLHWRQAHICRALGIRMESLSGTLHLASLRGALDNELASFAATGKMTPAPAYYRLVSLMKRSRARLVVLDNVAHFFTGNENDRSQVTAIINLLNRAAGETGAAIVLLGHPNKAGDSYSGSTAWLNAVRSQVFMGRADAEEGDADTDARTITVGKPNYTARGEALRFRWHEWAFVLDEDLAPDTRAEMIETTRATADNTIFLTCLAERTRQVRAVSERRSPTFAPTVFEQMPDSKRIGRKRLEAAMDRLFRIGAIERAYLWDGPDRKPVFGLREVAGNGAGNGAGNTAREQRGTVPEAAEMRAGNALNTHTSPIGGGRGGALEAPLPLLDNAKDEPC